MEEMTVAIINAKDLLHSHLNGVFLFLCGASAHSPASQRGRDRACPYEFYGKWIADTEGIRESPIAGIRAQKVVHR
jgi:hypothetical protein